MKPFKVGPDGGDPRWVTGSLDVIKVTSAQTNGAFAMLESLEKRGDAPPLHVHEAEDEAFYIIDGTLSFFIGDDIIEAEAGSLVFAPRKIPHAYRVDSAKSRILAFMIPGGFDRFFAEVGDPAELNTNPPSIEPDFEQLGRAAAKYGVTIVGPPPE